MRPPASVRMTPSLIDERVTWACSLARCSACSACFRLVMSAETPTTFSTRPSESFWTWPRTIAHTMPRPGTSNRCSISYGSPVEKALEKVLDIDLVIRGGDEVEQLFSGPWQQVGRNAKDLGYAGEGQRIVVRAPLPGRAVAGAVGELEPLAAGGELELGTEAMDRRTEDFGGAMEEPDVGGSPVLFVFHGRETGNGLQFAFGEQRDAHDRLKGLRVEELALGARVAGRFHPTTKCG